MVPQAAVSLGAWACVQLVGSLETFGVSGGGLFGVEQSTPLAADSEMRRRRGDPAAAATGPCPGPGLSGGPPPTVPAALAAVAMQRRDGAVAGRCRCAGCGGCCWCTCARSVPAPCALSALGDLDVGDAANDVFRRCLTKCSRKGDG